MIDTITKKQTYIQDIIDFIIREGKGLYTNLEREKLEEVISKHLEYGTALIVEDKKGIVAVARWNWLGKKTVYILDLVIREDYRSPKMIKYLIALGISKNPQCEWITFTKRKSLDKGAKFINIKRILKRRKNA